MKALMRFLMLPVILSIPAGYSAQDPTQTTVDRLVHEIINEGKSFDDLKELTDLGHRLSGSSNADRAIHWAEAKLKSYGLDRVWLQPMQAPSWERGSLERARITSVSPPIELNVAALGNSVGTGAQPIEANVIEVESFDELKKLGSQVKGKIVFFSRAMDSGSDDPFKSYGELAELRVLGPAEASKLGAVATLIRSLSTRQDDFPHTGITVYKGAPKKIPGAALSTRSASLLAKILKEKGSARVSLELSAEQKSDVPSYNVIGEITGTDFPNEIVVVGGHLDSWDLSAGAHDDGAGVVHSIEVLRAFKKLGIRPKRTVRVVLFMSEEFGGYGGEEYARVAIKNQEKHVAALESDRGGFAPRGFSVTQEDRAQRLRSWSTYLAPLGADRVWTGFSGTDVEPLEATGTVGLGFMPEPKHYFDLHHSARDRLDQVIPEDLKKGSAAMAVLVYLISELGI